MQAYTFIGETCVANTRVRLRRMAQREHDAARAFDRAERRGLLCALACGECEECAAGLRVAQAGATVRAWRRAVRELVRRFPDTTFVAFYADVDLDAPLRAVWDQATHTVARFPSETIQA